MNRRISTPALDDDRTWQILKNTTLISRRLSISQELLKPCIAQMIEEGLSKGFYPDRNTAAFLIAGELKRIGLSKERILNYLKWEWNCKNKPPLSINEIHNVVKSAFRKDYSYGCNRDELKPFCIGKEMCPFIKACSKEKEKFTNQRFLDLGWQLVLSSVATKVYYLAIPKLESIYRVGIGGRICANYKRIAYFAGVSPRSLKKGLLELKETPLLVRCEIGTTRKWEKKATVIQRKRDIPELTGKWLEKFIEKKKKLYCFR